MTVIVAQTMARRSLSDRISAMKQALTMLDMGEDLPRRELFYPHDTSSPASRSWQGRALRSLQDAGIIGKVGDSAANARYRKVADMALADLSDAEIRSMIVDSVDQVKYRSIDQIQQEIKMDRSSRDDDRKMFLQFDVSPSDSGGYDIDKARVALEKLIQHVRMTKPPGYKGIWMQPVVITPMIAIALIQKGNPKERNLTKSLVSKYASEMSNGLWTDSPDPIILDVRGRRCNGHHRLQAVVESGKSIRFLLAVDVADEIIRNLDTGKGRSLAARMTLDGLLQKESADRMTAVAAAVYQGGVYRPPAPQAVMWPFVEAHKDNIERVEPLFAGHKRGIGRAAVSAIFVRILHNHPNKFLRLVRVAEILCSGICDPRVDGEKSIIKLRDALNKADIKTGGASNAKIYRLGSRAIYAFLNGENLSKLHEASENYYPLPEDGGRKFFEDKYQEASDGRPKKRSRKA
jgi:hypothetical protein